MSTGRGVASAYWQTRININHSTSRRKWKQISERERYKIEALAKARMKPKEIAAAIGRDRRTIEREIARGSVTQRDSHHSVRDIIPYSRIWVIIIHCGLFCSCANLFLDSAKLGIYSY
jgi:hypothetical protein